LAAHLVFMEVISQQNFKFCFVLLQFHIFVEVPFFRDQYVMLQSGYLLTVDICVISSRLDGLE